MAVLDQSGPAMAASTRPVTYDWPSDTRAGGCSLTLPLGTTQLTAGSVPLPAAVMLAVFEAMSRRGAAVVLKVAAPAAACRLRPVGYGIAPPRTL